MPKSLEETLNPTRALIFRITHRANIPGMLRNGLRARHSDQIDESYVPIGNPDLIEKRRHRAVPIPPGGTLADYIPFYFTPFSPMMYNIKTGYGIQHQPNEDIVVVVSSLHALEESGVPYVFTDRHAYLAAARFFGRRDDLYQVDFGLLQRRDFKRDPEDPEKVERYQAEALAHSHVPLRSLLGVACYTESVREEIDSEASSCGVEFTAKVQAGWYFR